MPPRSRRRAPLSVGLSGACLLFGLASCQRPPHPITPRGADAGSPRDGGPAARADAAPGATDFAAEPPEVLLRAASLAVEQGDRATARRLLELGLSALARTTGQPAALSADPVLGLADVCSEVPGGARASLSLRAQRAAVAHGHLLSIVELTPGPGGRYATRRLAAAESAITAVALSTRGDRVATREATGALRLFAVTTGKPLLLAEQPPKPSAPSPSPSGARYQGPELDFSPDGELLLVPGCGEGDSAPTCLQVFATSDGHRLTTLTAPASGSALLDFTVRPDDVAVALWAGLAPQFYLLTKETRGDGRDIPVRPAAPLPTSQVRPETPLAPTALEQACARSAVPSGPAQRAWVVSPDREHLAVQNPTGQACLWETARRRPQQALALRGAAAGEVPGLVALLDGAAGLLFELRSGRATRSVLLDAVTGRPAARLGAVVSAMPLDDGRLLLTTASGPRRLAQLLFVGAELGVTRHPPLALPAAPPEAVSGDGRSVLFPAARSAKELPTLPTLVTLEAGAEAPQPTRLAGSPELAAADFFDDGRALVLVERDARLRIFDVPGGAQRFASPQPPGPVRAVRFSPDGQQLLVRLGDEALELAVWLAAGRVLTLPATTPQRATAEARSPDGRLLARGGADGAVTLLRATDRQPLLRVQLLGEGARISAVVLALGGRARGRFATLGDGELAELGDAVWCHAGPFEVPVALCAEPERLGTPAGELMREALGYAAAGTSAVADGGAP